MPAIDYPPFDGDGVSIYPHRPSLDNLGGNTKADDQNYPPSSDEPSADEWNRFAELLALLGASMPTVMMTIDIVSGTPQIDKFWAANSALTTTDFPLVDNGTGDTTISWAANLLPPSKLDPELSLHYPAMTVDGSIVLDEGARTMRVRTSYGGSPQDMRFTVVYR
jgi:hypothetical protein